jgi:hypothetical protein
MSKKHFTTIAEKLRASAPAPGDSPMWAQWRNDCNGVADALAADAPSFDRARFLKACGA